MPLQSGTRLGVYEVLAKLGEGGMGEVYRARDTKLNRDVALKILPESFEGDPDRLARFRREAQVLASLNHPHIAHIYGLEDSDGTHALVLELVDGPTLADRLARGPLPIDEALPIARQIAEALEAAHEQGIIHRDLKPANIKVRDDGTVKVLDFGLAKMLEAPSSAGSNPGLTNSPTITTPAMMTGVGMILGTAAFMSPEQAKGRPADKRSDVWAFGCVLYEMLTGKRAFDGEDVSETLAAVLRAEPNWSALPAQTPAAIRSLLSRCLQKDQRRRLPTLAVVPLEIDEALSATPAPVVDQRVRRGRERLALTTAAIGLAAAVAVGVFALVRNGAVDDRVIRFVISLPEGRALSPAPVEFVISPDGRQVVLVLTDAVKGTSLWLRALDALTARELPGTEGATAPFWSPDSHHVGFRAVGKLKKIDISGGQPITLCDLADIRGGSWSADGTIIFASGQGLKRVPDSGGIPADLGGIPADAGNPSLPRFLPDGRHFLYRTFRGVFVASLDSAERKQIFDGSGPALVQYANGHLLFERDGTLLAQPFDPRRVELTGEPRPVADGIQTFPLTRTGLFSVSNNGTLVYQPGSPSSNSELIVFDRSGKAVAHVGDPADYDDVSLSQDGKRAVVTILDPARRTRNIWIVDVASGRRTQFTFPPDDEVAPAWSADGSRIAFSARRSGRWGVYQRPASGAGNEERLFEFPPDALSANPLSLTRDGRSMVLVSGNASAATVSILPLAGDRKPVVYLPAGAAGPGSLSPDNRWMAYFSNELGIAEVFVTPYPQGGGKRRVSADGGTQPRWRSDGKELFYLNRSSKMMAADVMSNGDAFEVGAVRPLFDVRVTRSRWAYDVTPDGKQFLVNTRAADQPSSPLTAIVNWPAVVGR